MAADIAISALVGAGGSTLLYFSGQYLLNAVQSSAGGPVLPEAISLKERALNLLDDSMDSSVIDPTPATNVNSSASSAASSGSSVAGVVFSSFGLVLGLAMVWFSATSILMIIDKYNVKYTAIPTNMVDTVETVNGNRYVNYQVVNSLYMDGDKKVEKPGDTNGYDGEQWNAIYYTKSYEAGKCMTANAYVIDSESNFGKYTPVAKFGSKNCYDLNSFNDNENGDQIYIAFGNSNNKKTAATSVPTVIGSIFSNGGAIAISGVAGLGIGMALMAVVKRKKQKPEENNETL
jgi:hypothetical protein